LGSSINFKQLKCTPTLPYFTVYRQTLFGIISTSDSASLAHSLTWLTLAQCYNVSILYVTTPYPPYSFFCNWDKSVTERSVHLTSV
jgi:hypothetical protein